MHKMDLALNNLKWLIFHKTEPNQTRLIIFRILKEDLTLNNKQWLMMP